MTYAPDLRDTLVTYFCIFVYTPDDQSAYWYQTELLKSLTLPLA